MKISDIKWRAKWGFYIPAGSRAMRIEMSGRARDAFSIFRCILKIANGSCCVYFKILITLRAYTQFPAISREIRSSPKKFQRSILNIPMLLFFFAADFNIPPQRRDPGCTGKFRDHTSLEELVSQSVESSSRRGVQSDSLCTLSKIKFIEEG